MKLFGLSLRNMRRYRARTVITVTAVTVSVFISVVVDGFLRGIFDLSTYNLISYESSEVTVYADGYFDKKDEYPDGNLIEKDDYASLSSSLDSSPYSFAPRYKTAVTLLYWSDEEETELELSSLLVGVDAIRDAGVFSVYESIDDGRWFEKGGDGIILGSGIAEKLSVGVGDYVTVEVSGRGGFREVLEEEIIGIANTGNPEVNRSEVFMDLEYLDSCLLLDGAVSEVAVSDGRTAVASKSFRDKVQSLITSDNLEAYFYEDVNSDLMAIMNGDKGSSIMVLVFLFIIAAAGISNTMIMAAMERQKESAMMRSVGFSRGMITAQFVFEGFLSGVAGAVIGSSLAFFVLYPLCRYGLDISSLVPDTIDFGYRIPLVLKAGLFPQSFITIPLLALLFSSLSAYFPVRSYGRKEIADLFRRS